jgi:NADPH:quinone reductase-like Zn-dependent oxidoreductase
MKTARIHNFGGPDVIVVDDVAVPVPGPGEVLVQVAATGVDPWDALIREGKSKVAPQPPLTESLAKKETVSPQSKRSGKN